MTLELLRDYLKPGRTPWSEDYHNSDHADSHGCCIVCGRATKGNGITVILGEGGDTLILPENDEWQQANDAGYMGWWTVGPECGRAIPQKYRVTVTAKGKTAQFCATGTDIGFRVDYYQEVTA